MISDMHYRVLYDIAKGLHDEHQNENHKLQTLLGATSEALGVSFACLMTFNEADKYEQIFVLDADGISEMQNRNLWTEFLTRGIIGYVYHSDRSMVIRNIQADPRWSVIDTTENFPQTGSAVGIPITINHLVFAVMVFVHEEVDHFDGEALNFLDEIATLASNAFANMRRNEQQAKTVQDTRYHTVFEHTPVPVILTSSEGVIVDANHKACEFLGFQRIVLQGIPLQDVNIVGSAEIEAIGDEEKYFPTNTYDIDGNSIPTLIRARHIELDGKRHIEWILQDMSVQMELEQLRSDLTAMVYHDLRGPMGSIHMAIIKLAELLQGHDNPAVLKILQLGLRSTQQVSRLVEALLDIQRLEGGSSILDKQASEVHVFLTDAFQLVMPIAEQAGINIDLDISKMPEVTIDTDMMMRVVINLMENAIKYTPNGSNVTLRTEQIGDYVQVSVSDTGPGIPKDMLDNIFNKFSRVKYQNAPKGVGLGLAFCRLAVEAHGGRIWVESDGESGSDFIFTLPLEDIADTAPLSPELEDEVDDSDTAEFATIA